MSQCYAKDLVKHVILSCKYLITISTGGSILFFGNYSAVVLAQDRGSCGKGVCRHGRRQQAVMDDPTGNNRVP